MTRNTRSPSIHPSILKTVSTDIPRKATHVAKKDMPTFVHQAQRMQMGRLMLYAPCHVAGLGNVPGMLWSYIGP